jgi:hypothetical protein
MSLTQKILLVFQKLRSKQHTLPAKCPKCKSKQAAHASGSTNQITAQKFRLNCNSRGFSCFYALGNDIYKLFLKRWMHSLVPHAHHMPCQYSIIIIIIIFIIIIITIIILLPAL